VSIVRTDTCLVGWPCPFFGAGDADGALIESANIYALFKGYQNGTDITTSIEIFGEIESYYFPGDGGEGNGIDKDDKWELSGCWDFRTFNRQ